MITLKTLPQATAQQVFDQVATHLLKQNARSVTGEGSCRYRNPHGLMCAAGCLIGDDEYTRAMEGIDWGILIKEQRVPPEHEHLIRDLQCLHDGRAVHEWRNELYCVASNYDLNTKVLEWTR